MDFQGVIPTEEEVAILEKSQNRPSFFTVVSFSECTLRCLVLRGRRPNEDVRLFLGSQELIGESNRPNPCLTLLNLPSS